MEHLSQTPVLSDEAFALQLSKPPACPSVQPHGSRYPSCSPETIRTAAGWPRLRSTSPPPADGSLFEPDGADAPTFPRPKEGEDKGSVVLVDEQPT